MIDLYVKQKVLGDAVKLFKTHRISEFSDGEFLKFRSYHKVFDPEIEEREFGDVTEMDKVLEMYIGLCGMKFTASLSRNKFSKIVKWFTGLGNKKIISIDADIAFKNAEKTHGSLDLDGFVIALKFLICKAWGFEGFDGEDGEEFFDYVQ